MRRLLLTLVGLAAIAASLTACASDDPAPLSLEDAVGQMLLIGFRGETLDDETTALLEEIAPGGVILFDYDGPSGGEQVRNIVSPDQLKALTASLQDASELPLLIAIDAEGGFVNRLKEAYGFEVQLPSHLTLGAGTPSDTESLAGASARQLSDLGINWNLAPVVDVNVFPESPAIGYWERSFSDDPDAVADHAAAFAAAHHDQGVVSTLKHFPGHGSAVGDTHLGVTDVTETFIREDELAPYRTLIDDGYNDVVMTAHVVNRNLDPSARPATLSRSIITDLLRGELGFAGVILSDDMQMGAILEQYSLETAAIEAIKAGVDVILIANQNTYDIDHVRRVKAAIIAAVERGEISRQRIDESVERILALKRRYGLVD